MLEVLGGNGVCTNQFGSSVCIGGFFKEMNQIKEVISIAQRAAEQIMNVYKTDFEFSHKKDTSPVTEADLLADRYIHNELQKLNPRLPILSEEQKTIPYHKRKYWKVFWLVDPLDGTKEFISRKGEFTVNIALIKNGYPVLGVIQVPAMNKVYYGSIEIGAFKIEGQGKPKRIQAQKPDKAPFTIVISRSHATKEQGEWQQKLAKQYDEIKFVRRGSSLKFCEVAEGNAQFYPRLGPTMEWDTAAGQAIVEAAGGTVTDLANQRLRYNKKSLMNSAFYVKAP